ncbi:ATPase, T2SS/T4P/T4SS family, partial [Wenyingzhuangia sp. 1_MG-2023]|nr:ATPase, T2SS/T4P/T4SS family [Wenyingzhuangia sp. 1_MG-2023]
LNVEGTNISTAEDPAEINLEGVNQCNVSAKVGLDFAAALRSFLRQDPDVIMVGEIRDLETAQIAIKAAQTGHLVLSTLHTNNAPETITRLANMGVPSFNIATSVSLIIAQRLARRLCKSCKIP